MADTPELDIPYLEGGEVAGLYPPYTEALAERVELLILAVQNAGLVGEVSDTAPADPALNDIWVDIS